MKQRPIKPDALQGLPLAIPELVLADFLGVSLRTVRNLKRTGRGPVYIEAGRRTIYLRDAVIAWMETGNCVVNDE